MKDFIRPDDITHEMMVKFAEYHQTRSVGEGAKSILQRFKKVVRSAVDQGIMAKDPCKGVVRVVDDHVLKKDVLSQEEIQKLMDTHYQFEKENVRNAFIFCLYTGMRFCDVKDLRYSNIDYANKLLRFEQDKTKGHSARSWVTIPLNDGLIHLVGKPKEGETKESLIFNLPSYESCCKSVKRWVKRAGIDKHISWHCARHSFAVNILNNGANIKTVASLLGHSGLKHTEKYTRAVDKLKEDAINSLPASTYNIDSFTGEKSRYFSFRQQTSLFWRKKNKFSPHCAYIANGRTKCEKALCNLDGRMQIKKSETQKVLKTR